MNNSGLLLVLLAALVAVIAAGPPAQADGDLDLTNAVVVTPAKPSTPERNAVRMLVEEVAKRSQRTWPVVHTWPRDSRPVIAVGPTSALRSFVGSYAEELRGEPSPGREGYRIRLRSDPRPAVLVVGSDARGVLFGVGHLLRKLRMERGQVRLPAGTDVSTAPKYALRGHQLGYRPKTNSYDGWTLPMWEQYYRDLAVFGSNAVELIPPRSDDDADSPHFPLPPMEMMVGMSKLADDYGLDVWVWYPALDEDYSKPETVGFALKEWAEVFRRLPRIDAVFVPGGDPGHTPPKPLMALLEKQTASLRRYHPKAQMWVSPQGFDQKWMDEFLGMLCDRKPEWLTGLVFGPQNRVLIPDLRKELPARYQIRHYPDITHSLRCQYPVPDWDPALAITLSREPINPRPLQMTQIFRQTQPQTIGFLTYSEGCNDDANKAVWSALGWDPDSDVREALRDYSRYFMGDRYANTFAEGLLALERNWVGPLAENEGVEATLRQFQALERSASPAVKLNWRFQQVLYRAYYDAYVRRRLLTETALEERAIEALRGAGQVGAVAAMERAEAILDDATVQPVAADLRARLFELAEALFQSIRMQLSVSKYQAIGTERGANLDNVDVPLNDRRWLKYLFGEIRNRTSEAERLRDIEAIIRWSDPGPGGFYDDLGNPSRQPHLVRGLPYAEDPAFRKSPFVGFGSFVGRLSTWTQAETLYEQPLQLRYTGLDPQSRYRVKVIYGNDRTRGKLRMDAGDGLPVHDWIDKPPVGQPVTSPIPRGAIRNGELLLTIRREPGFGGNGRGCQVAEVWLLRE
jgi:hypothetical protein